MEEDKLLKLIKKSADSVEIPEGLKPETMEEKLHTQRKLSGFYRGPWGKAAVAAAICLVIGAAGIKVLSTGNMTAEEPADVRIDSEPEERELKEVVYASAVEDVYIQADSYEAVYQAMYGDDTEKTTGAEEIARDYGVNMLAEESAVAEESVAEEDVMLDAAAGSGGYSTTNIQELGVDEADIVKTDGNYIYVADADKGLRIIRAEQGKMELVSMTPLEDKEETIQEMYVDGDTLNLITYGYETSLSGDKGKSEKNGKGKIAAYGSYAVDTKEVIRLYTYDISDRSRVQLAGMVSQEGGYQSSRKVGDIIYLFGQYWPSYGEKDDIEGYIPEVNGRMLEAEDIMIPAVESYDQSSLVVSSVNVTKPDEIVDCKSILAGSNLFYVSTSNIYITLTEWGYEYGITNLVRFSYDEKGKIQAEAAGTVKGYLNDNFSLNEYEDHLRVVTTCYDYRQGGETNSLYVLDGDMKVTGKIEDLAYQETIRSARFMGDTGYFVTFRQTDPLFSVDLSDPSDPKILGELKVTGFSSYLHFYGEDKLLGIGWEADENTGETTGLKLSMFDISDPSQVTETDRVVVEDVYDCQALNNYKSILVDPEKNLLGFAYIQGEHGSDTYKVKGYYYRVFSYEPDQGFTEQYLYADEEAVNNGNYYELLQETRGLYIGDWFYLCNSSMITSFDMTDQYEKGSEIVWE
ncbi:MAG: beta-propeller domain-containing protein [Lachnospiraceae bacterium]|jgi:inhibitor of cysteine peptidase